MIYSVIYIDSRQTYINIEKLKSACEKMKIEEVFFSDFAFCPYIIANRETRKDKTLTYVRNVNYGFFNQLSQRDDVVLTETKDIKEFVTEVYKLHFGLKEIEDRTNALF